MTARTLKDQRKDDDALQTYRKAIALDEQLANDNPDMPFWLGKLAEFYAIIGNIYVAQGQIPEAKTALSAGRSVTARLDASKPTKAWKENLAWFDAALAKLGN
jgi:tetratricopeptide (TPR) repeat protein